MSNPITSWIKSHMELYNEREEKFEDRVASMSINSVKLKDSRNKSHRSSGFYKDEPRTRSFDHFFVAHSTLKSIPGGISSSHQAMEFYNDLGAKKRERMIAKFKDQE
eukprot:CAMPEP_0119002740 /NCGR_PEP_ID=MMETSP1176-20130426/95_1 /TAXON_ID=265551 /ORGANISM="Synedropsis recta cf, Strain CCMP1620" /LENGTH=106 /DNA_ID=CAMNT_0006954253 /DNA_START=86 /DNA_END=406 /DNA_ORIENTATION=+